jgi:hypothetical protein
MKFMTWLVLGICFTTLISGCGKKKAADVQAEAVSEAVPTGKLPELEQNKVHLINPIVTGPQDTAFEPVPSEQEEMPAEEQALLGPPLD